MTHLSGIGFLLALTVATPAVANPWINACEQFYALTGRTAPAAPARLDVTAIAEHYARGEALGFSGGAAVQRGNTVLLNRGYGFADWRMGVSMTPDTVFDIGSVSKQFTAAAILKLEEQGRLSVEDPISRFFPEAPQDKREITVHQLLTHSAGLRLTVREALDTRTRDEMTFAVLAHPLAFAPGERFAYSNAGYELLAAIVEIASGRNYEAYLRSELWLPAGLRDTGWVLLDRRGALIASGYNAFGSLPTPAPGTWIADGPTWGRRGQGSILSTMNDLRRWAVALRQGGILSRASLIKMLTPHIRESPGAASFYGYGWAISAAVGDSCVISHNGSNNLHFNVLRFYPEKDLITHEMTNQAFSALQRKVIGKSARVLFGVEESGLPRAAPLSDDQAARLAGAWRTDDGTEIELFARGSRLILPSTDPGVAQLFTPFSPLPEDERKRIAPAVARLTTVIDGLAKGDYSALNASLSSRSTPAEEEVYWRKQWAEWIRDHGGYRGSQPIGSSRRGDDLVTWILIQFERRNIVAGANHDQTDRVFIGNDIFVAPATELLPSEYVLTPTGGGAFQIFNASLPGVVRVRFDEKGERMTVTSPSGRTQLTRTNAYRAETTATDGSVRPNAPAGNPGGLARPPWPQARPAQPPFRGSVSPNAPGGKRGGVGRRPWPDRASRPARFATSTARRR